jgi:hypothetical protein
MNIKAIAIGFALASISVSGAHATVPLSGLVGYWTGDGNANDSSTTANNGTFTGSYAPGPGGGRTIIQSLDRQCNNTGQSRLPDQLEQFIHYWVLV